MPTAFRPQKYFIINLFYLSIYLAKFNSKAFLLIRCVIILKDVLNA
nr:MAG TPA: hypothetical protein [Caudoviricetes sp.]DAY82286.1 MAG TPA: hypothetical protein [Caudoviricetes sp.]